MDTPTPAAATPNLRQLRLKMAWRALWYSLGLVAFMMLLGGVGFWLIDPRINSLGEGVWLAFTTAATVGYGDVVPSTNASRLVAVVVVLVGLAVISLVTASLTNIFAAKHASDSLFEHAQGLQRQMEHTLLNELSQMRAHMAALQQEVERLHQLHASAPGGASPPGGAAPGPDAQA